MGKKLLYALYASCLLLVIVDFVYHRHGHFDFEKFPLFFAIYGFLAFVFVVFVGAGLRLIVSRPEDYYGDASEEPEAEQAEDHLRG